MVIGQLSVAAPTASRLGTVNLVVAAVALVLAAGAVVGVFMAARLYGGEIGEALVYVGGGVTVFSLERLWYAFSAVGVAPRTLLGAGSGAGAVSIRNLLLLGAAALLAIGFFALHQTMSRRTA